MQKQFCVKTKTCIYGDRVKKYVNILQQRYKDIKIRQHFETVAPRYRNDKGKVRGRETIVSGESAEQVGEEQGCSSTARARPQQLESSQQPHAKAPSHSAKEPNLQYSSLQEAIRSRVKQRPRVFTFE